MTYTKRCPSCGQATSHQWTATVKETLVYTITLSKRGGIESQTCVDSAGSDLEEYTCKCGAGVRDSRTWAKMEVVEVDETIEGGESDGE